jgi:hypothetical protein
MTFLYKTRNIAECRRKPGVRVSYLSEKKKWKKVVTSRSIHKPHREILEEIILGRITHEWPCSSGWYFVVEY